MSEIPAHIQIALLDMRKAVATIEFEIACAQREQQMGGWIYDHPGAIELCHEEYTRARDIASTYTPLS